MEGEGNMTTQQQDIQTSTKAEQTSYGRFLALPGVQRAKPYPRGYRMLCPVHHDTEESLIFWEDESNGHVGLFCFANCQRADICAALGIRESDLYNGARPPKSGPERKLDLLDLALDKFIHPGLLISIGLEDGYTWKLDGRPAVRGVVRIPYYLEDGSPYRRNRIRTAKTAKSGSYWEGEEAPIIPYGLWKLAEARAARGLWLVEGESDCWTHWYHKIPTLGIPGAAAFNTLEAAHLSGIDTLYIVQEPATQGKKTDAGKGFVDGLCKRLKSLGYAGEVYLVSLKRSHNVKDPNDLHKQLFVEGRARDYPNELQKAAHEATPLDLSASLPPPAEHLAEVQPLVEAAIAAQDTTTLYELAPRIAGLPTKEQAVVTTLVKKGMKQASGFSLRAFNKLVKEAAAVARQGNPQHVSVTNKPDIALTGDIEVDAQAALMALYTANVPPVIFIRRGRLARCRKDEEGRPIIEEINESIMLYEMARAANFVTYSQAQESYVPTYPPLAVARHILSQGSWKFPALRGITEVPVIREDGTILDRPGYDPMSKLIYLPDPTLVIPPIPANPTQKEAEQARDFAWQYIAEFPYETTSDAANAFGLLLTVVIRTLVSLVPMAVVDATKQGSGKGLLAKFVASIALGRSAASMVPPGDENEWRKTLTSLLVEGETLISLDNVEGLLHSPTLASFLTADVWKARLLGTMQSPDLIQRSMVIANGNNMQLGGDIPRRSYRIRMDAGVSKPWMRTGFTFSPLLKYARADRGKIIAALLTMVRAWYVAGQPQPSTPTPALAEFSAWAEIIGGVLAYAGVDGFVDNLAQLYDETDVEGPQWTGFLEMWLLKLGNKDYTTATLLDALKQDKDLEATLPEPLAGLPLGEEKEVKAFSIRLGRALRKRKGTPYGPDNVRLVMKEDKHSKQKLWSVTDRPVTQAQPSRLDWSQPHMSTPNTRESVIEAEDESTAARFSAQQAPASENERHVPTSVQLPEACEAPQCDRRPEGDDGFPYDTYGHAWCCQHASRRHILERGGSLQTPFPMLFYARGSRMLEESRASWEAFVLTAPESAIGEVLQAIESRQAKERLIYQSEENTA